jgi:hypothetical protein
MPARIRFERWYGDQAKKANRGIAFSCSSPRAAIDSRNRKLSRRRVRPCASRHTLPHDADPVEKNAQQYVGRLHRLHENKKEVLVYDYADVLVPMLARMYKKQLAGYSALGMLFPITRWPEFGTSGFARAYGLDPGRSSAVISPCLRLIAGDLCPDINVLLRSIMS